MGPHKPRQPVKNHREEGKPRAHGGRDQIVPEAPEHPPCRILEHWYIIGAILSWVLWLWWRWRVGWGGGPSTIVVETLIWFGVLLSLMYRFTAFPIGEALMASRKSRNSWTIHARVWQMRRLAQRALASSHDPCLLPAFQMVADLRLVDTDFPPGTHLELATWLMAPYLKRRAQNHGWKVEPIHVGWLMAVNLRLGWLLMPRAVRVRGGGPFRKNRSGAFRLSKTT